MGQAKRRAAANRDWLNAFTDEERIIADAAERLLVKFIDPAEATGMCYQMTFFLRLYLCEKGIATRPVIGYINDGTDDVLVSHAWLEFSGKKVDLTLGNTERPELNPIGEVIILDRAIRSGCKYSYQIEKSPAALAIEEDWLQRSDAATIVIQKREEHLAMLARSANDKELRLFLDSAPDGFTFGELRAIIDR